MLLPGGAQREAPWGVGQHETFPSLREKPGGCSCLALFRFADSLSCPLCWTVQACGAPGELELQIKGRNWQLRQGSILGPID